MVIYSALPDALYDPEVAQAHVKRVSDAQEKLKQAVDRIRC
jgi:hypothetical protein